MRSSDSQGGPAAAAGFGPPRARDGGRHASAPSAGL